MVAFNTTLPVHLHDMLGWGRVPTGMMFLYLQLPLILLGGLMHTVRDRIGLKIPTAAVWVLCAPLLWLLGTYAIPTISRVLRRKSDFSSQTTWYKRYSDTVALMVEALANSPASRRGHEAIARMKYLHHAYRKSGSIIEDDMLYTLGLLTIEPAKWIDRYEWDQTSQMEKCAMGTFWKSFGDAMEVSYESLPSGKEGFKDGLQFFEEIGRWCRDYEMQAMRHSSGISDLQDQLIRNVALGGVPKIFHNLARNMILVLMDDQLRLSMGYRQPAQWVYTLTHTVLLVRKYILRHLVLPRPLIFRQLRVNPDPEERSPHPVHIWEAHPYYVAPTLWNRWGLYAWIAWFQGRPLPGDDGDWFMPRGFDTRDIGPSYMKGRGRNYAREEKAKFGKGRRGQCPF
ncbi:hypothetical protein ABOM_002087 [Aspergillus bombycis]|uniref:ER-bound oxygenase mpaB/mpaB'/Rubber oxygenase catalytic domain-containing protein n=1 Tax=Aspergillus bombycis TaxID=109264 RepID=A0A1F8A8X1_9EURO|nr:hypothetical protein ABOM_002087 [Aspergillus bombycis]OGM48182.1 hypothetical protein ABOM_002087 [Aspergillus bombycis]